MKLHSLRKGTAGGYTTFGCMWERGRCSRETVYSCIGAGGRPVQVQSRVTAYWPDGSVKWTAHTADSSLLGEEAEILPGEKTLPESELVLTDDGNTIQIAGEDVCVEVSRDSNLLFGRILCGGRTAALNGRAVLQLEEPAVVNGYEAGVTKPYEGIVTGVETEEQGPLQCILKFTGFHRNREGEEKMPFIIRLRVNAGCSVLHFTHTFLYDGDENRDFLKGLGIAFDVPVSGEMYNRHVKLSGDHGVFHEAAVPLTSWRPRIPGRLYERQMRGEKVEPEGGDAEIIAKVMGDTPFWGEYDICQDSALHFYVRKKISSDNCCYLDSLHGGRTDGAFAFGSEGGSVMMCIRDFWEKYPSGYTVKGLDSGMAECSVWFWSPGAAPMDFRHYAERGYNQVCYEGYDYKGADPRGIACTNECILSFSEEIIPGDSTLRQLAKLAGHPPVYVAAPEVYHRLRAFGYWSLPGGESSVERKLERQLERAFEFYRDEVEQRGWYGMFDYGDVMHTYDNVRHQWKYDIGGYAWDNTELVPTLWLWLYFMRTGREDVFDLAERMTRHTSEVDVYHMGSYKGLGSRHNVRHWGCPCKEARIAMAAHHRFLYYLTGDRRLEDIFEELKDNELTFLNRDPLGDFYDKKTMVYPSHARSGPDWSSLCSNWMTRWERFNDTRYLKKIRVGIEDIRQAPLRLSSGSDFEFEPESCHLRYIGEQSTGGSHLQICMGATQVWLELGDLMGDEEWQRMVAELGRFYFLSEEDRLRESGGLVKGKEFTFAYMAAGIGAYGARYFKDDALAAKVWEMLLKASADGEGGENLAQKVLHGCGNREELREIPGISTNFTAQFCLNVIMALEFIREKLPLD